MEPNDIATAVRSPEGNLGFLFRVAYQAFRDQLADALKGHDLTAPQYSALSAFEVSAEMSSADLARVLDVSAQAGHTTARQLVDMGLLEQVPKPLRGRTLILSLTSRGRTTLAGATAAVRTVESEALHAHSPRDQLLIKTWLAHLAKDRAAATSAAGR